MGTGVSQVKGICRDPCEKHNQAFNGLRRGTGVWKVGGFIRVVDTVF